jgi:sodium-dependent dicarboxylate transporter 2/3/5
MAFVFTLAALFWALEVIPLFATSLLVILLQSLLLAETIPYTHFLIPLSNPVIVLFLGGFVLAKAFQKYKIDHWIVSDLLHFFGHKSYFVLLGFMVATAFLGMWISNTATTALMLPMIFPLLHHLNSKDSFKKALVLAIPFAARIGGITTPVGTPTNAIAIGLLQESGISIHFLTWTLVTFPLAVILLLSTSFILYRLFPPHEKVLTYTIEKPSMLDSKSKIVIGIGLLTAFLWLSAQWSHIPEAVTALLCISLLTGFKLVNTDDIKKIDWDILLLMWGGLALGEGMIKSGLASWVTSLPILPQSEWQIYLLVCLTSVFLSTFISNTATVNLLIPIALSIPVGDQALLAAIVALGASFDIALPTATPPMAMAYGTREISIKDMLKAGIIFAVLANGLLLLGAETMMKRVFIR